MMFEICELGPCYFVRREEIYIVLSNNCIPINVMVSLNSGAGVSR